MDVTHALEDGGGRELAYVAMSRARGESHVHVVAPDIRQAARRLPGLGPGAPPALGPYPAVPEGTPSLLYHERQELRASVPPDRSAEIDQARRQLRAVEHDTADLHAGGGRWATTTAGAAARGLHQAAAGYQRASRDLEAGGLGPWGRHKARRQLNEASDRFDSAKQAWELNWPTVRRPARGGPRQLTRQAAELDQAQRARKGFLAEHPDVPHRLADLDRAIEHEQELERPRSFPRVFQCEPARHLGMSHELDRGLGIDM